MRLSCNFVNVYTIAYRVHVYTRASLIRIHIRLIEYFLSHYTETLFRRATL